MFFCTAIQFAIAQQVDFESDIAPILEERCWYCHGEDEQESDLRLDLRAYMLKGGNSGLAAVVPGKPEKSYLLEAVMHVSEDMAMPPDEEKIPAQEIELLERWIEQGAVWPGQMDAKLEETVDHWSFQPIVRPEIPAIPRVRENPGVAGAKGTPNQIDAFLLERLSEQGLRYSAPA
ncbi:MAG: c-type cytochrome domain-containing protein, partial [Planctomycetota bacterium]